MISILRYELRTGSLAWILRSRFSRLKTFLLFLPHNFFREGGRGHTTFLLRKPLPLPFALKCPRDETRDKRCSKDRFPPSGDLEQLVEWTSYFVDAVRLEHRIVWLHCCKDIQFGTRFSHSDCMDTGDPCKSTTELLTERVSKSIDLQSFSHQDLFSRLLVRKNRFP